MTLLTYDQVEDLVKDIEKYYENAWVKPGLPYGYTTREGGQKYYLLFRNRQESFYKENYLIKIPW